MEPEKGVDTEREDRPFLKAFLLTSVVFLFVALLEPGVKYRFWVFLLKALPMTVLVIYWSATMNALESRKTSKVAQGVVFVAFLALIVLAIAFDPVTKLAIERPPKTMSYETAQEIVAENEALLNIAVEEMLLPEPYEVNGAKEGLKIVSAYPDLPKSKLMIRVFRLGNIAEILRHNGVVYFVCGDFEDDLYEHSTLFYYAPGDAPEQLLSPSEIHQIEETGTDQWLLRGEAGEKYHVTRILPHWYYASR